MKVEPEKWSAVVFDFDGTLARLNIDFAMMRAAVRALPLAAEIPPERLDHLNTIEMIEAARAFLAARDKKAATLFAAEAYRQVATIEIEAARQGGLFAGARELLAELRGLSLKIGVITRNCRAAVLQVFPDIGLYTDVALPREDSPDLKPHPGHLRKALLLLGAAKSPAAMIGDHPMDIAVGRKAGCCTIGVLTGSSSADKLRAAGADAILRDIFALPEFIRSAARRN